ncbi:MAG: putative Insecticidal toxin complex protein TccB2 [Geoglossum umbratile]|nr:MAG: putative Insecticidal toxin complex protein TccB2 [Geoglossum umbratile]
MEAGKPPATTTATTMNSQQPPLDPKAATPTDPAVASRVSAVVSVLGEADQAAAKALVEEAPKHGVEPTAAVLDALQVLRNNNTITDKLLSRLTLANSVAELAYNSVSLIKAIDNDQEANDLSELARHWQASKIESKLAPTGLPADKTQQLVALEVTRKLFTAQPTATVAGLVISDQIPLKDPSVKAHIVDVLTGPSAPNIAEIPIAKAVAMQPAVLDGVPEAKQSAVIDEIRALQRVQAFAPVPEAIPVLMRENLTTALQVSLVPEARFVEAHADSLGEDVALELHSNVMASRRQNEDLLIKLLERVQGTGLAILDDEAGLGERKVRLRKIAIDNGLPQVNFDSLFGGMDQSLCDDCKTVYSAAAYLVELLQFLRSTHIQPVTPADDPAATDTSGTALEALLRRRPDLLDLELTCANTNTLLPYIDLASEVMESFIANLHSYRADFQGHMRAVIETYNVTEGEQSADLLAQPENTNFDAYQALSTSVYPFTLPYHQPIDSMRTFLNFIGVDRADLLDKFRVHAIPKCGATQDQMRDLQREVLDRQVDAEVLGLIQEDYIILTKEGFFPKKYFDFAATTPPKPPMTDKEYRRIMRVQPVHKYYGYKNPEDVNPEDDETAKEGLRWVRKQFLKRSGVTWMELVDIVQTNFVNPRLPREKDRVILEHLQFSYKFLQTLVDWNQTGVKNRLGKLADFLVTTGKFVPLAELLAAPASTSATGFPSNAVHSDGGALATASDGEVREWVYVNFEMLGDIIVLDYNEGPELPASGLLFATPKSDNVEAFKFSTLPSGAVGYVHPDGRITDARGEPWGNVDIGSRMVVGSAVDGVTFAEMYQDFKFDVRKDPAKPSWSGHPDDAPFEAPDTAVFKRYYCIMDDEGYLTFYNSAEKGIASLRVEWEFHPHMGGGSDISNVMLTHLNGKPLTDDEWDRLQIFIRLWRKLGWTTNETDMALVGLTPKPPAQTGQVNGGLAYGSSGEEDQLTVQDFEETLTGIDSFITKKRQRPIVIPEVNPELLHRLVYVLKISRHTGLTVEKVLTLCAAIPTLGKKSLYAQLFLTRKLPGNNAVFLPDSNGNYLSTGKEGKISDNLLVLMAAFTLRATDIQEALYPANASDDPLNKYAVPNLLTLENVSKLYRYSILAKQLKLPISSLIPLLDICGDPLQNPELAPQKVFDLLQIWDKFQKIGLSFHELEYVVNVRKPDSGSLYNPLRPDRKLTLTTLDTLRKGLTEIEKRHSDLDPNQSDLLTTDFVRAESQLILDESLVSRIISLLEGTTSESTSAPAALDLYPMSDSLKKKLTYDPKFPRLQIKGILTDKELDEAKSLIIEPTADAATAVANRKLTKHQRDAASKAWAQKKSDWSTAIGELRQKPNNFFINTLTGIFTDEKEGIAELCAGDLPDRPSATLQAVNRAVNGATKDIGQSNGVANGIHAPTINTPGADGRTAAQKRQYYLSKFLPVLRKKLAEILVIDTMKTAAGLRSRDLAEILLNTLIIEKSDETHMSALEALMGSLKAPGKSSSVWSGFLLAPSSENYVFFVGEVLEMPQPMTLDKKDYGFSDQLDGRDLLWSTDQKNPIPLVAGKLYELGLHDIDPSKLQWRGSSSVRTNIPTTAMLPDYANKETQAVFDLLKQAAIVVEKFKLTSDEIRYIHDHADDFNYKAFDGVNLDSFKGLLAYTELRDSLPPNTSKTLLDLFGWAANFPTDPKTAKEKAAAVAKAKDIPDRIAEATGWNKDHIQQIFKHVNFAAESPEFFRNETILARFQQLLILSETVGVEIPTLFRWCRPLPPNKFWDFHEISQDIQRAVRSRYDAISWTGLVKPLQDKLRENQKNSMISYLLVQDEIVKQGYYDADGLFEFFLIDVQMTSLVETSRIKQAIATVQLFVQRCLLGLEGDSKSGVDGKVFDKQRWDWMKNYRVWEANRKVFLYPENWIDPALRDDKSPFYVELEGELMQKDLSKNAIAGILKNYLSKVEDVSNLTVAGLHVEKRSGVVQKVHIFARTRTVPFTFSYRYYDAESLSWYPWIKMDIDIPYYTMENWREPNTGDQVGSYLLPIVWQNRLLVFTPQIIKKTYPPVKPQNADDNATLDKLGQTTKVSDADPIDLWDVKMSWTEYKDGKWSQRKLSTDAVVVPLRTGAARKISLPPIDRFFFAIGIVSTPIVNKITIGIYQLTGPDTAYSPMGLGQFDFNGGQILKQNVVPSIDKETITSDFITSFGYELNLVQAGKPFSGPQDFSPRKFHSTQADVSVGTSGSTVMGLTDWGGTTVEYPSPLSYESSIVIPSPPPGTAVIKKTPSVPFYHPFTHTMMSKLTSANGVDALYGVSNTIDYLSTLNADDSITAFGGSPGVANELKQPYSLYNWEYALHAPMALADRLFKSQQFDDSLNVLHLIFNPLEPGHNIDRTKVWRFPPFKEVAVQTLEEFFVGLADSKSANAAVHEWREKPFQPHVVARTRPLAYMKYVVMKYIEVLIAYGDYYFRLNTLETVPNAIQMYVLASHLYGPRGQKMPRRDTKPQTYRSLIDQFDEFSNAMVNLEENFPFSNQTPLPVGRFQSAQKTHHSLVTVFGSAATLYFAIPDNPRLRELGNMIDDRLFKLRHSQDITGVTRKLPLFEPPIDPALLVQAAAQGLSLSSVLSDLNGPMPNYRFEYLLGKALELASELKSLGSSLLTAREKCDGELLSNLRAKHDTALQTLLMDVKKLTLDEAQKSLETLEYSRLSPVFRLRYYLALIGADDSAVPDLDVDFQELAAPLEKPIDDGGLKLIPYEKEESLKLEIAQHINETASGLNILASVFEAIPRFTAHGTPLGIGGAVSIGGAELAALTNGVASALNIGSSVVSFQATSAARKANFLRALQDRIQQANLAGYEIKNIDKQVLASKIRIQMADKDISIQQKQIDQMGEVEEFLRTKYSNHELYQWMEGSIRSIFYETYTHAYDLAKKAEKAFKFERPQDKTSYIQAGYWDPSRDGFLSGERLYAALKSLETAYQEKRSHEYEITKNISLRQLDPLALICLRETGVCEFKVPEVAFDVDFPGHFLRKIKSVGVTIPAIVGPYVGVNCTLQLNSNSFRINEDVSQGYPEIIDGSTSESRFMTNNVPISSIAVSSGQNDSGLFELNFKDERYIPFEGAGAISSWRMELPSVEVRQWDYATITDVVLHVKYTSMGGSKATKEAAVKWVKETMENVQEGGNMWLVIDLKNEFARQWSEFAKASPPSPPSPGRAITLTDLSNRLPIFAANPSKTPKVTEVAIVSDIPFPTNAPIQIVVDGDASGTGADLKPQAFGDFLKNVSHIGAKGTTLDLRKTWKVTMGGREEVRAGRCWLVGRYRLE